MNNLGIDRKQLTVLYELNHVLKRVFTEYVTLPDDFVIGTERNQTDYSLYDIAQSSLVSRVMDIFGSPIVVKSENLFHIFRDHKKNIETVAEKEGILYVIITGIEPIEFGYIVYETSEHMELGFQTAKMISGLQYDEISAEDINDLSTTDVLTVEKDHLKVRFVRKLFPHLSKTGGEIATSFFDEEPMTFKVVGRMPVLNKQTKTIVNLYHIFKCFKY